MMTGGSGVSFSKKQHIIPKDCCKVNTMWKQLETRNAIAYLKMRSDGCPRNPALIYCQKTTCRFDSTKTKDGPSTFRKLKLRKEKNPVTENGWYNVMPMYDLGKGYTTSIKEIIQDPDNDLLDKNLGDFDKNKDEFKDKVHFLYEYYSELVDKASIINLKKKFKKLDEQKIVYKEKNIPPALGHKLDSEEKTELVKKWNKGISLLNKNF